MLVGAEPDSPGQENITSGWSTPREPLQKASVNDRDMMRVGGALLRKGLGNEAADIGDGGV